MMRRVYALAPLFVLVSSGIAAAQDYPMMNMIADKVVQRYQQASCEDLWKKKGEPKSPEEQNVIQLLQGDPQMRTAFIDKVAAPIANKMFQCGLIP